jgi:hypothetical protein
MQTLSIDNYYAGRGAKMQTRCKPCHNLMRKKLRLTKPKTLKPKGFQRLPEEQRTRILNSIATMSIPKIAEAEGIKLGTLNSWKYRGQLH